MSELFTDRFDRFEASDFGSAYDNFDISDGTAGVNGSHGYVDQMAWLFCDIPAGNPTGGVGTVQFDFFVPPDTTDGGNTEGNYVYWSYGWPKANAPHMGAGWFYLTGVDVYALGDGTWEASASSNSVWEFTPEPSTWYTVKGLFFAPGASSRTVGVKVWKKGDVEPDSYDSGTSSTGNNPSFQTDYIGLGGGYTHPTWIDNIRVWDELVNLTEEPTYAPEKPDPTVTVQIKYDGVDITDDCVVAECWFTARASGFPGEAQVVIRDDAQLRTFIPGSPLELFLDGVRQWDGYAIQRKHNYWFDGHTANCYPCPHLTPRKHILVGTDRNVLFERRVLYNKADPDTATDNIWPAGTPDEEAIEDSISMYLDDVDGIDYTTKVENVGSPDPWVEFRLPGPTSMFGQLMRETAESVGAIFYIDPDRYLVYTDVNEPNAPFALTDKPEVEGDEVGYREMYLFHDGTQMVNDAMIWGAGQGSPNIVFSRVQDSNPNWFDNDDRLSMDLHGRWQNPNGFRTHVWNQGSVDRIANSIVYGSPSSKRGHKDDKVSVECTVFAPGLRVADKVEFTSHAHDFTDVIPVRNMRISFPTPYNVKYELRLSHELDEPWSIVEPWVPEEEGEEPGPEGTNVCTIPEYPVHPYAYAFSEDDEDLDDEDFLGTQNIQRGDIENNVSIEADGFPPNKETFWGDNDYEGTFSSSGGPKVDYDWWFADKYWYNNGSGGLQIPGPRIVQYRNRYVAYTSGTNTLVPYRYKVRANIQVTLTMSGTQAERDITGHLFPFPGISRNGTEPAEPHHVQFGLMQPSIYPKEAHTAPGSGGALFEGELAPGDVYEYTAHVVMWENSFFMLGIDFMELPEGGKPWMSARCDADVVITYTSLLPTGGAIAIGPDADGVPCIEQGSLGHVCETAVHLTGTRYRVRNPYALGTTSVSVDGLRLSGNGIHYAESSPQRGEIELTLPPTGDVYVCYDASYYSLGMPSPEALFVLPVQGTISGTFGSQQDLWPSYYWHGTYYDHFHNGVDFAVGEGTPVYAAADGNVAFEDQDAGGMMIHIYHDFYGFRTTYAHLSQRVVDNGASVLQGQLIAYSGASGAVTGAHLHWGLVHAGSPENPLAYTDYTPQVVF